VTIEEFIEKCQKRQIPDTAMERARMLAREIVEGAYHEIWRRDFQVQDSRVNGNTTSVHNIITSNSIVVPDGLWFVAPSDGSFSALRAYLGAKWRYAYPSLDLLIGLGYFEITFQDTVHPYGNLPTHVRLTVKSKIQITLLSF
jgi:hypothetical protein